jgi:phospholipid-binding lipoprotein MlaA
MYVSPTGPRVAGTVTRVIDQRAVLLDASNLLEEAALDRYEFIRDGFLQRRQNRVFDGETSRKELKAVTEANRAAEAAPAQAAVATPAVSSETASK